MEQPSCSSGSGICPVCSQSQENLTQHLTTHSKEEIIQVLSPHNLARENAPLNNFQAEECRKSYSSSSQQECSTSSPVQSGSAALNPTVISTASLLPPYQATLSVPAPLLTGIKSNAASVLPSTFPPVRTTYIPNGPASSSISQFAPSPSSIPVLYRHPSAAFPTPNEGNSTPIMLQSPQLNINSYKGFANQNVIGSYGVAPSLVNQASSLSQSEIASTSSQIPNPATSLESLRPSVKVVSNISGVNNVQSSSNFSSTNGSSTPQGQPPVLCILPFAQIQPSVQAGGNYFLYGNNLLPATNVVPDVLQPTGMNYMLAANASGMPVNNSQFPNTMYYLPSNMPPFGLKAEAPTLPQTPSVSKRSVVAENRAQTSYTKMSSSAPQTLLNTSPNSILSGHEQQHLQVDKCTGGVAQEAKAKAIMGNAEETESKTTIEVGSNIKISIPKDIIEKKERLKELINRELVRAILINDSEDAVIDSKENVVQSNFSLGNKKSVNDSKECFGECSTSRETNHSSYFAQESDQKSVNTFTSSCNQNNTDFINLNNLQIDPYLPSTSNASHEDSHYKLDSGLPLRKAGSSGISYNGEKQISNYKVTQDGISQGNQIMDLSTTSHIDALFARTKAQLKQNPHDKYLPSSSGIQSFKFKNENEGNSDAFNDTSLTLLSPEKNFSSFLGDAVFSDISYAEDHVLGAVEEVFPNENSGQSTSIDCKSNDLMVAKASTLFSFGAQHDSFENQLTSGLPDEDTLIQSPKEEDLEASVKMNASKYSKTYFRVKKSTQLPHVSNVREGDLSQFIADTSQINVKLQNFSEQTDEEIVDDPSYEELETSSNAIDTFQHSYSAKSILRGEDESFSDDSKDVGTSLYQGVPLKIENGESNGTHTEEVMSLKASETLADSDSERATPNEEIDEMYYGKNFIFAGEPGPPNLSTQEYPDIEDSEEHLSDPLMDTDHERGVNVVVPLSREDTISLTLDANCSILPADSLHFPQLFDQGSSNGLAKESFLKEETLVRTRLIMGCSGMSPLASTSGLQTSDLSLVKKNLREDEEYDFEYESDCYADSDSDHLQRGGPLDLEKWRCNKCQKTFKSLKEKLLHSGHHLPCSSPRPESPEGKDYLMGVCEDEKVEAGLEAISSSLLLTETMAKNLLYAQSTSTAIIKTTRSTRIKRMKDLQKLKQEQEDEIPPEEWEVVRSIMPDGEFKCSECPQSFPTLDKLYDHRSNAFKSRYVCPICHCEFKKRLGKLRHLKLHPLSELKCLICHRNFDSYYSWSQHQLFHMGLITYECKECGHKCQRKGELEIHYRKHSGEKPFKCETCLSAFVSNHSLKRHLVIHMEGQEIECDVCHKRYKNAVGLSKHKLKMHPKKKKFLKKRRDFMCDTCNEVYHSEKKLAWHQETHEKWPKKCQQCGECFIHQADLTKHIRRKHDSGYIPSGATKDSVTCAVCKKAYKRSSISLHMRTHTGVKPYKCNVCGKEFTVKCNYLFHKWVHTGIRDRPFKCKLCEKSFPRKRFLEAHVRSHKKIRPYTCNECGKSFIHKRNYQTHTKLHTEEKQHECTYCGKTFFRKYNLNNHVRIHTKETPYECTICNKLFTQKSNLNVHMKAFHVERHAIHEEV